MTADSWLERLESRGTEPWLWTSAGTFGSAQLAARAGAVAEALRAAGAAPGSVVAFSLPHGEAGAAALLACLQAGCSAAPLRTGLTAAPAGVPAGFWLASDGSVSRLAGEPPGADHPLLRRLAEQRRPGLLLLSSGTTARPKVILHDLLGLMGHHLKAQVRRHRVVAVLAFDHIGGLDILFGVLASGSLLVVPDGTAPDAVGSAIASSRATVLPASPTLLNLLLAAGVPERHDLSSLRVIACGSEPLPVALRERVAVALPGARIEERFGTSETGALRSRTAGPGLIRIDDPDTEWRVEAGELWLRSPRTMLGYLSGPSDALSADGWFRTGDLAEALPDGSLRVLGRLAERINVGGEKVMPGEVEEHLLRIPGILACRVHGEPHPLTGSVVAADVVWSPPVDAAEARKRIRGALQGRIEAYKIPVKVRLVASLGATDRGKRALPGEAQDLRP